MVIAALSTFCTSESVKIRLLIIVDSFIWPRSLGVTGRAGRQAGRQVMEDNKVPEMIVVDIVFKSPDGRGRVVTG